MSETRFHCLDLGITKCYLIQCSSGYFLVDTGYSSDYGKFVEKLRRLDISISDIKYVFLTHHHDDHAGFLAKLLGQTDAKLIVHKNAVAPLQRGEPEYTMKPVNLRIQVIHSIFRLFRKNVKYPPVLLKKDDLIIQEDDEKFLASIGIDGKIIYTPGHSSDSMSIVLGDGNAFVGDLAMNFLRFSGIKHRPIYLDNIDDVFDGWKRITENGARTIHPAHGSPFPAQRLTFYRNKFTRERSDGLGEESPNDLQVRPD